MSTGKNWQERVNLFSCKAFLKAYISSPNGIGYKTEVFQDNIEKRIQETGSKLHVSIVGFQPRHGPELLFLPDISE